MYPVQDGTAGTIKHRSITSPTYEAYPMMNRYYSRPKF